MSEEQRAPLLSDERMDWIDGKFWWHAAWVRDWYESKIASGELMTREQHEKELSNARNSKG